MMPCICSDEDGCSISRMCHLPAGRVRARSGRRSIHCQNAHLAMTSIRVVIADDDLLVREGIGSVLHRSPFEVVGLAGDAVELMTLVRQQIPDVVVLDIRMPPTHTTEGLDAAQAIRAEFPQIAILVLSAHIEVNRAMDLIAEGQGIGYLLKNRVTEVDEFAETLERVAGGGSSSTQHSSGNWSMRAGRRIRSATSLGVSTRSCS